jgi:hypothetical protein
MIDYIILHEHFCHTIKKKKELTVETAQSNEPIRKTIIPNINIHFLPKMSENFENKGSKRTQG